MAVAYIGAGAQSGNTSTDTTRDIAYPSNIQAGDLIVMYLGGSSANQMNNPSGWTQVVNQLSGGLSPSLYVGYKVATGSESGNQTVTSAGSATVQGRMFLFRGVDTTTPIDVTSSVYGNSVSANPYAVTGVTTTKAGTGLLVVGAGNSTTITGTSAVAATAGTLAEIDDRNWRTVSAYHLDWSGSGATGNIDLTWSSGSRGSAALLALRPMVRTVTGTIGLGLAGIGAPVKVAATTGSAGLGLGAGPATDAKVGAAAGAIELSLALLGAGVKIGLATGAAALQLLLGSLGETKVGNTTGSLGFDLAAAGDPVKVGTAAVSVGFRLDPRADPVKVAAAAAELGLLLVPVGHVYRDIEVVWRLVDPQWGLAVVPAAWSIDARAVAWAMRLAEGGALNRESTEYLQVAFTASVTLDQQPVELAVVEPGARPGDEDWIAAEWVGQAATSRTARILIDDGTHVGLRNVYGRVTDDPEVPVLGPLPYLFA